MKHKLTISAAAVLSVLPAMGQSAFDAYNFAQTDIKGTARFMSMGGAFGALGADLSTLSYNPAGIGVYRRSDVGFTLNLDAQRATATGNGASMSRDQTKFLLNNIGGVFTFRLPSNTVPNLNIGFTYNKSVSYNRAVSGVIPSLRNSITNYIAGMSNAEGVRFDGVDGPNTMDLYYPQGNAAGAPWLSILGYNSYFISPGSGDDVPEWYGQFGEGTTGTGRFDQVIEGAVNEYNLSLGGNIADIVFWGMDFGIIDMNYSMSTRWGETLQNAYVDLDNNQGTQRMNSNIALNNSYWASGNGFNYKLGVIVKPIQSLRIGFAVHTPTWYSINENYGATTGFLYGDATRTTTAETPTDGYDYNLRTPWRFIASIAGVIGNRLILSADYDWQSYQYMHFSQYTSGWNGGYWDDVPWWDDPWYWAAPAAPTRSSAAYDPFADSNSDIKEYYKTSGTLRLGAEYRVTPRLSVRAGYAFTDSPVKQKIRDNSQIVYTSGLNPSYSLDDRTDYASCGVGYNFSHFYMDLAYVYKHKSTTWHAYTPDPSSQYASPEAKVGYSDHQVLLSMGFRF